MEPLVFVQNLIYLIIAEVPQLGRCNKNDHHNLFLENLPIICKCLIHSYIEKTETTKGTKWEQKIQKPQNENIYLTNLNMENNGNFPILSF